MNEDNIHLSQKGGVRSQPYDRTLVTKEDPLRRSAPSEKECSLAVIFLCHPDISHIAPQCDFIPHGLSQDAGKKIEDGDKRRKGEKEEREGTAALCPLPTPQGQEGTDQILNAFPVSPPYPSPHLAPGHFSCNVCHLRPLL